MSPELMNEAISVPKAFASLPFPLEPFCAPQCAPFSKHMHFSVDAKCSCSSHPGVREAAWPLTLPGVAREVRASALRAHPQCHFTGLRSVACSSSER